MSMSEEARRIESFIAEHMIDEHGVLYTWLHPDTLKPLTQDDWNPINDFLPVDNFTPWEVMTYENSGMTTGAFLAAMSYKYRVTGDEDALCLAKRAFEGLKAIYDLGAAYLGEGFFTKPYGWRASHEISTDQYLYAMKGMMAYRHVASDEHLTMLTRMITKMVDFWVGREYRYDYFTLKNMLWPMGRFPALLLMAYEVSGDKKYLDEFIRINEELGLYRQPADSQLTHRKAAPDKFSEYEISVGRKYLLGYGMECAVMDIMELDECLQLSDAYSEYWLKSMRQCWQEGNMFNAPDGMTYAKILYDPASGEISIPEPGYIGKENPLGWSFLRWVSNLQLPRTTMLARVGVNVAKWLPELNAAETVNYILSNITLDKMKVYYDPYDQLLPEHKYLTMPYCGDTMANWLWAYWQDKSANVIFDNDSILKS